MPSGVFLVIYSLSPVQSINLFAEEFINLFN